MRKHDWITEVLDDMAKYARLNELPMVELTVNQVRSVAALEIRLLTSSLNAPNKSKIRLAARDGKEIKN